jgi:hypothetical protein
MARVYFVLSFAAALLVAGALPGGAAEIGVAQTARPVDHTTILRAVKAQTAPPLDASLESPVWQSAVKAAGFENFNTREPAKYETDAYFLYDDQNLYVGIHAVQQGTPIVATQNVDNAGVLTDDHVAFSIDTSGNGSRVYSFKVTPKGVHDETSSENARYAPDWTSIAKVMPNGDYNVMMVIPLSDIRAQSAAVQSWKMNVVRFVAATNDEYTWAYEPTQTDVGSPQYWPTIQGLQLVAKATRPQPHADVYALSSSGADHRTFQNGIGNFVQTNPRAIGVDVTYPITNTLAVVGTLNPDFSNVEQDQTSIAPQMFQRQYREYRPFFAQGAQYINSMPSVSVNGISDSLFYTPRIGIFDRGLKVEGTIGRNSIGALNVTGDGFNDTAFGYSQSNQQQTFGYGAEGVLANHTGVKDDTLGTFVTRSNPHSGEFTMLTFSRENNSLDGSGGYLFASEGVQSAKYFGAIDYRDISPNFNPIDGYTAFNDIRGPRAIFQYNGVGGKGGPIKSWTAGGIVDRFVDSTGQLREYDANASAGITFKNQLSVMMSSGPSGLRFDQSPAGDVVPFSLRNIMLGYKDGSPSPVDASYAWGPFGGGYLQQMTFSTSHQFGLYGLSLEYDGTVEHASAAQPYDTQWLRRISLTRSFGRSASLAIGLRGVNGYGGFATPGTNLALSYHKRFANLDELYVDYGTPASPGNTIHRLIVKYIFHAGGGSGT